MVNILILFNLLIIIIIKNIPEKETYKKILYGVVKFPPNIPKDLKDLL